MPLRFFFDECADEDVARGLRRRGVDVVTAAEWGGKNFRTKTNWITRTGRLGSSTPLTGISWRSWQSGYGRGPSFPVSCTMLKVL